MDVYKWSDELVVKVLREPFDAKHKIKPEDFVDEVFKKQKPQDIHEVLRRNQAHNFIESLKDNGNKSAYKAFYSDHYGEYLGNPARDAETIIVEDNFGLGKHPYESIQAELVDSNGGVYKRVLCMLNFSNSEEAIQECRNFAAKCEQSKKAKSLHHYQMFYSDNPTQFLFLIDVY